MERLTTRCSGYAVMAWEHEEKHTTQEWIDMLTDRLAAYEDTGLEPEQVLELKSFTQGGIHKVDDGWKHAQELLRAEQDGRLVVLPCKVGDAVYFTLLGRIIEKPVFSIVSFSSSTRIYCAGTSEFFRPEDICKTVFLTHEEAEAEMKGGHEA